MHPGDIIETGTFRGGTTIAILFALADRAPEKAVWAADSFQGLPVSVAQDQKCDRRNNGGKACDIRSAGTFMSTRGTFESNLWRFAVNRTRLRVVEGWFSQTLPTSGMRRRGLSFIRADGDLYMSTRDALRALYPLLRPGGVIYIDDYGSFGGCGKAVDEFRDEHNISSPLHEIWEDNHSFFEAVWWTKAPSEYTEPSLLA
jgi:O-methyltransferase